MIVFYSMSYSAFDRSFFLLFFMLVFDGSPLGQHRCVCSCQLTSHISSKPWPKYLQCFSAAESWDRQNLDGRKNSWPTNKNNSQKHENRNISTLARYIKKLKHSTWIFHGSISFMVFVCGCSLFFFFGNNQFFLVFRLQIFFSIWKM